METEDIKEPSPWCPETDLLTLAIVSKLAEEASELAAICARIIMQGHDGLDPETGKPNLKSLQDEIADVEALSAHAQHHFGLNRTQIEERAILKYGMKEKWFEMIRKGLVV